VQDLLTTRQLQDLLKVDRITIYRMLQDGRLHGFKVGGQWRFSRAKIEAWLEQRSESPVSSPAMPEVDLVEHSLPLSCAQGILAIFAEALHIGAVIGRPDGTPLAPVSNSCRFCQLILDSPEGAHRCAAAWGLAGGGSSRLCHAGLSVQTTAILVDGRRVANVACCQFAVEASPEWGQAWQANLPTLAADLGLDEAALRAAAGRVRTIPQGELAHIEHLLIKVAETFAEIAQERARLFDRLQQIARMANVQEQNSTRS